MADMLKLLLTKRMPTRVRNRPGWVIAASVALTIVLVSERCLSVIPYKLQAEILPAKFSMFYTGPYDSIIGDANYNFTVKHGYALQLGRLQITYMKAVPST